MNAENLTTAIARPVFTAAKRWAKPMAKYVVDAPVRDLRRRTMQMEYDLRFNGGSRDAKY